MFYTIFMEVWHADFSCSESAWDFSYLIKPLDILSWDLAKSWSREIGY